MSEIFKPITGYKTYGEVAKVFDEHAEYLASDKKNTSAKFRSAHYKRAAEIISANCRAQDKISTQEVENLPLTQYMKEKIMVCKRSKSECNIGQYRVEEPQMNRKVVEQKNRSETKSKLSQKSANNLLQELSKNYMGLGLSKAKQLVEDGLTSVSELKKEKWMNKLPIETRTFLAQAPETPILHEDIKALEPYITGLGMTTYIVGSYRRKKPKSNDIDVMLVDNKKKSLDLFLDKLKKKTQGKVFPYSKGLDKMSLIINTENITAMPHVFKLDIFRCSTQDKIPMILYSTGSKEFNIQMRAKAKSKGLLLNQNGLFYRKNNKRVPGLKTEKDYFDKLDMVYLEPPDRS